MQQLVKDLKKIKGLELYEELDLKGFTTFKVGSVARIFLLPRSISALESALKLLSISGIKYKILGNGSNLLIKKAPPVVISLSRLNSIVRNKKQLIVYAGVTISALIKWCLNANLGGLEPLFGIPGSIGGAVFMNAGACGISIGNFVEEVLVTNKDGITWQQISKDRFSYRKIHLPKDSLICAVKLKLSHSKKKQSTALFPQEHFKSREIIKKVMKKRLLSQPIEMPSAGCIFKNPQDVPAWYLIAKCGLRGYMINGAQVSKKHANFIINRGNASSTDILNLINFVKEKVDVQTNITLEEEVVIWQ